MLIRPGVRETYGARRAVVGTQVDLVPTMIARLGTPFVHQCWGRDLLALPEDDPGFGMVKPSGSDKTEAFIQGDTVLVRSPDGGDTLFSFSLYPEAAAQRIDRAGLKRSLSGKLSAYVQSAMRSLIDNTAGLNDDH